MARQKRFPKYPTCSHRSGNARIFLNGKDHYLGTFNSPESWERYNQLLAEWNSLRTVDVNQKDGFSAKSPPTPPPKPTVLTSTVSTVASLVEKYLAWMDANLKDHDGKPKQEVRNFRQTVKPLLALHGHTRITDFGSAALLEVQQAMADGSWVDRLPPEKKVQRLRHKAPVAWSRKVVNHRVQKIKGMFDWGVVREIVPEDVHARLLRVKGLKKGRTMARERPDVPPVPDAVVEVTLPHLGPVVGAMVRLQRLTGMRPGEVCSLRPCDLDRGSLKVDGQPIWIFRPPHHKSEHLDRQAAIVIGPKAQEVLLPFLDRPPEAYCFSPEEATAAHHAERTAGRKLKLSRKRVSTYKRKEKYTVAAYGLRIRRVCDRHGISRWHPHQLRHSSEVEIERTFGLDGARAVLRHSDPKTTLQYGQRDLLQAAEIVAKLG